MILRPLHDGVLVKPDKPKRQVGLIHLPDSMEPLNMTGVVQRVGGGRRYVDGVYKPTSVQVGERVCFRTAVRDAGVFRDITRRLEGEILIGERDILFVIEGDEIPEIE